jgi:hypothetical protein
MKRPCVIAAVGVDPDQAAHAPGCEIPEMRSQRLTRYSSEGRREVDERAPDHNKSTHEVRLSE